ncbi:probable mediator of RNA polymerase II transcription subunit 15c [Gastrolobium bilobum]|uniref:probable mediator of RNA polymerase II transcription subunit 15c n=1 Tax=Gastrolobium bilobum TaxID=150636 RepID=UPI002AB24320|nr:probable mediator of RNA polymerase II transcription subunit 15c [Gastrolobium bilobum]
MEALVRRVDQMEDSQTIREGGKDTNIEWQEQVYQKVQRMKSAYFKKLNVFYQIIMSKLQQVESSQEPKKTDLEKIKQSKRAVEYFLSLLSVSKSQITTDFKERLDKAEKSILSFVLSKNDSSHHKGTESADVQSRQQSVPSHSRVSQMETFEKEPSPQILGTQMCLQEPQVAKQNSKSQQEANQLSIIKGLGNTVQQQTHSAQKANEVFGASVNTLGISASPMIEDCSNLNEISHKAAVISDEPSAAMQQLLKVLTSMSPEALSTSVREIKEVVSMNDGPLPEMVQQQNQQNLILQGWKMSRSINAVALDTSRICASTRDSFNQLTDPEESDLNSVTTGVKRPRIAQENCALLEEIREINKILIDTEIVIGEKDSIPSAAGGAAEHGEGLVVKFLFSAVTVNPNLISHYAADKKSIIKPLWLLVPTSYPFSSPVILNQMPLEISQFMHDPREKHLRAVDRILHYLKGTPYRGLLFQRGGNLSLEVYTDANYVGSVTDRWSTMGYCMFLCGNLITQRSKKQNVVARSSAEVEAEF